MLANVVQPSNLNGLHFQNGLHSIELKNERLLSSLMEVHYYAHLLSMQITERETTFQKITNFREFIECGFPLANHGCRV